MPIKKGDRLRHQKLKTLGTALDDEKSNGVPVSQDDGGGTTIWVADDCDIVPVSQGVTIAVNGGGEQITVISADGSEVRFFYDKGEECFYEGAKPAGQKFSSSKGTISQNNFPELYKWLKKMIRS
jgi:hypothetical protein